MKHFSGNAFLQRSGSGSKGNFEQRRSNAAVLAAYGFTPGKDLLAQVLALNLEVAQRLDASEPVVSPGVPPSYPHPERLITDDCIQAE